MATATTRTRHPLAVAAVLVLIAGVRSGPEPFDPGGDEPHDSGCGYRDASGAGVVVFRISSGARAFVLRTLDALRAHNVTVTTIPGKSYTIYTTDPGEVCERAFGLVQDRYVNILVSRRPAGAAPALVKAAIGLVR